MPRKKSEKTDASDKPAKAPARAKAPRAAGKSAGSSGASDEAKPKKRVTASAGARAVPAVSLRKTNRHAFKSAAAESGARTWELPTRYGETKAVLLARDPYWIYAYWEVTADQQDGAKKSLGDEYPGSRTVLRVFQSSGPEGGEPLFLYDVEVRPYVSSWYLNVQYPDRPYFIEIVQRAASGRVVTLTRSNIVTTPRDFVTPSPEQKWRVPETLTQYFRKEAKAQQTGISSAEWTEGFPTERYPSGKGL